MNIFEKHDMAHRHSAQLKAALAPLTDRTEAWVDLTGTGDLRANIEVHLTEGKPPLRIGMVYPDPELGYVLATLKLLMEEARKKEGDTKSASVYSSEWITDCQKHRGKILTGKYAHWCYEYDGLPVDETCPEWRCGCFPAAIAEAQALVSPDRPLTGPALDNFMKMKSAQRDSFLVGATDEELKAYIQANWKGGTTDGDPLCWGMMDCDRCQSGRGAKGRDEPCDSCPSWKWRIPAFRERIAKGEG